MPCFWSGAADLSMRPVRRSAGEGLLCFRRGYVRWTASSAASFSTSSFPCSSHRQSVSFNDLSIASALMIPPAGPSSGSVRVGRGGYYGGNAAICSVSVRDGFGQNARGASIGFRVCRTAQ